MSNSAEIPPVAALSAARILLAASVLAASLPAMPGRAHAAASVVTLHAFGATPTDGVLFGTAPLVGDAFGNFYGTAAFGGAYYNGYDCLGAFFGFYGCGTVFKLSPPAKGQTAWTETTLYSFAGGDDGASPNGPVVLDKKGNLYGTTYYGGPSSSSCPNGCGTVFKLSPPFGGSGNWTKSLLYSFPPDASICEQPSGPLRRDLLGNLFGTCELGGSITVGTVTTYFNSGTVYELVAPTNGATSWTERTLHVFCTQGGTDCTDGINPFGGVARDAKGRLYAAAAYGGTHNFGTVIQLLPPAKGQSAWTESTLYSFTNGSDGANPTDGVVLDAAGNLYGADANTASFADGVIFQLLHPSASSKAWTEVTLHQFTGGTDGQYPSGVIIGLDGSLYGTTASGGTHLSGIVFRLTPPIAGNTRWAETILSQFPTAVGASPGPLVEKSNGSFFGLATGGTYHAGSAFRLTP